MCCGEAGEKEKRRARGTMGREKREERLLFTLHSVSRALSFLFLFFFFFDYCYFFRDTQLEPLRRREPLIYTQISAGDGYFIR